jgi:RNA recognition motif-containing protein
MGKRLYVGNLPYSSSEGDLESKFAAYGTVETSNLIIDRNTGRSKGFAFVEMGTDSEAQAAIEGLNGTDYDGRPMTVNEAKPMRPRTDSGGGGGGGGGDRGGRW